MADIDDEASETKSNGKNHFLTGLRFGFTCGITSYKCLFFKTGLNERLVWILCQVARSFFYFILLFPFFFFWSLGPANLHMRSFRVQLLKMIIMK